MSYFLASPIWVNAANSADQSKDQDLLSHLLRNLASLASTANERNVPGLLRCLHLRIDKTRGHLGGFV